jgi:hypothetical protein
MATLNQIEANRRNSQHSTGPLTIEGKAASSMNALKSGIDAESSVITGEDSAALGALTQQFYHDCQPQTAIESSLVDDIIHQAWLLRRFARIDAEIIDYEIRSNTYPSHDAPAGLAFIRSSNHQSRLQRRIHDSHRLKLQAIKELERIQAARPQPQSQTPAPQPTETESPQPPIGFVPQTPIMHSTPEPAPQAVSPQNGVAGIDASAPHPAPGSRHPAPEV